MEEKILGFMKNENYRLWKECYEKTYNTPLTYTCDSDKKEN